MHRKRRKCTFQSQNPEIFNNRKLLSTNDLRRLNLPVYLSHHNVQRADDGWDVGQQYTFAERAGD